VVHTFRAGCFQEAIAQVKRVLGPDALVVSRRHLAEGEERDGGRGGVEITAIASNEAQPESPLQGPTGLLERRLIRDGVPERAARSLAKTVRERQHGPMLGMAALEGLLAEALAEEVVFGGKVGQGARVVAFTGPTGVGKTTTIAKIAAEEHLVNGRPVGLISIDQYRIGGIEQLQRYADLIGCPMEIASDAHSLEVALRRLSKAEIVLVDTAGRATRDTLALQAMAECLHGAQEPVEVQLCLPVAMREREMSLAIENHAILQPVRLTCTKVDEAVCCGSILAAHVRSGLPLAYFTTGQRVPEDLKLAGAELLASLLCGGETN
jgi:flagellar biosynthesis protein FlhF